MRPVAGSTDGEVMEFVAAAYRAGQTEQEVRALLQAAGWGGVSLTPLWQHLRETEATAPTVAVSNSSGERGEVPAEVRAMGFCVGAFVFGGIWCISNAVPWGWALLAWQVLGGLLPKALYLSLARALVNLTIALWLGFNGHRLAWQHRRFGSFAEFRGAMVSWRDWALLLLLVGGVMTLCGVLCASLRRG